MSLFPFFFFNDTATTEIYTLSLHDALPISAEECSIHMVGLDGFDMTFTTVQHYLSVEDLPTGQYEVEARASSFEIAKTDRKSTRLNSSHLVISYAVFCLKKKKKIISEVE